MLPLHKPPPISRVGLFPHAGIYGPGIKFILRKKIASLIFTHEKSRFEFPLGLDERWNMIFKTNRISVLCKNRVMINKITEKNTICYLKHHSTGGSRGGYRDWTPCFLFWKEWKNSKSVWVLCVFTMITCIDITFALNVFYPPPPPGFAPEHIIEMSK